VELGRADAASPVATASRARGVSPFQSISALGVMKPCSCPRPHQETYFRSRCSEAEFINADVRKGDDVRALHVDKTVARLIARLDAADGATTSRPSVRKGWPDSRDWPDRQKTV